MKKVLSILSLAAILIISPNFAQASLLGDEVFIAVESAGLVEAPSPTSEIVIDDPGNPEFFYSLCGVPGGSTVDVGESEIWFTWGSGPFCIQDA